MVDEAKSILWRKLPLLNYPIASQLGPKLPPTPPVTEEKYVDLSVGVLSMGVVSPMWSSFQRNCWHLPVYLRIITQQSKGTISPPPINTPYAELLPYQWGVYHYPTLSVGSFSGRPHCWHSTSAPSTRDMRRPPEGCACARHHPYSMRDFVNHVLLHINILLPLKQLIPAPKWE